MSKLEKLIERIIRRVNIHLRGTNFDVAPYIRNFVPLSKLGKFYGFYGITSHHAISFQFSHSSLAGSYFLGNCKVHNSVLYKSDIRGDELKSRGDTLLFQGMAIPIDDDELILIKDSFLVKTLVHNYSHDPEKPELFLIKNSASTHYANIHGSPIEGCFLGPFSTVDLTSLRDCVIGPFAYLQVGELSHSFVKEGRIWIRSGNMFDFSYSFPPDILKAYIHMEPGQVPRGILMEFVEERKEDFVRIFSAADLEPPFAIPQGASVSRYALIKPHTRIEKNVLVAQRAYIENSHLGKGANAQENCYIIDSRLAGNNVTAHGGKIIHAQLGRQVFVGFNAFLRGREECPLTIGTGSIVMPHTIVDLEEPLDIPSEHLVWGHITNREDLKDNTISLQALSEVRDHIEIGLMHFHGNGATFVQAFNQRIEHILEANGAYFNGQNGRGHAQKGQKISFNTIQPYQEGALKGLFPTIDISP